MDGMPPAILQLLKLCSMPLSLAKAKEDAPPEPKPTDDEGSDSTPRGRDNLEGVAVCNAHADDPEQGRRHHDAQRDLEEKSLLLVTDDIYGAIYGEDDRETPQRTNERHATIKQRRQLTDVRGISKSRELAERDDDTHAQGRGNTRNAEAPSSNGDRQIKPRGKYEEEKTSDRRDNGDELRETQTKNYPHRAGNCTRRAGETAVGLLTLSVRLRDAPGSECPRRSRGLGSALGYRDRCGGRLGGRGSGRYVGNALSLHGSTAARTEGSARTQLPTTIQTIHRSHHPSLN